MPKLTSDSIDDLKKGVDVLKLPTNFRDAIDFCRRLGLTYLWIDALCEKVFVFEELG